MLEGALFFATSSGGRAPSSVLRRSTFPSAALGLLTAFASLHLAAGCSSSDASETQATKDGSAPPTGATSTSCVKAEDCPNIVCECQGSVINSRHCTDGYCLDEATTCADVCGTTPDRDSGSTSDAGKDSAASKDASVSPAASGDACVPVSVSSVEHRVDNIASLIAGHQAVPPTPANGTVNVSRNTAGAVTYVSYDAPGSADDYTDSLSYDSAGHVTYWNHNGSGTTDVTESFSYDSKGHVTYFNRNADGTASDLTESFSYDSSGHLTYFNRNADGTIDDVTETFSYDSMGRVTYWSINADGSTNDASLSVSYSSSGQTVNASGTRAAGATLVSCN
jgi:hypothetical protein